LMTRREFLGSLVDFAAEGGTVLISSHSISELERTASHAAFVKDGKVILVATLDDLRSRFRRISMRCDGVPPQSSILGHVRETEGTGRCVRSRVQDPDPWAIELRGDTPGVPDVEATAVMLEEIYPAVIGRPADVEGEQPRRKPTRRYEADDIEEEEEEVRP